MPRLHILQGNNSTDKRTLERAAQKRSVAGSWIAPKTAELGDPVVIYIGGFGFFATARITSEPRPRPDWGKRRWGARLASVKLIDPPISLGTIRRRLPALRWAVYPRGIVTVSANLVLRTRALIEERRRTKTPDLDDEALEQASLAELRRVALLSAKSTLPPLQRTAIYRARSRAIHLYVLTRADGICEGCGEPAPFSKPDGDPYLEPHHVARVADDGPDHPAKVIALCPTCHGRVHHSIDAAAFNQSLKRALVKLETR